MILMNLLYNGRLFVLSLIDSFNFSFALFKYLFDISLNDYALIHSLSHNPSQFFFIYIILTSKILFDFFNTFYFWSPLQVIEQLRYLYIGQICQMLFYSYCLCIVGFLIIIFQLF